MTPKHSALRQLWGTNREIPICRQTTAGRPLVLLPSAGCGLTTVAYGWYASVNRRLARNSYGLILALALSVARIVHGGSL